MADSAVHTQRGAPLGSSSMTTSAVTTISKVPIDLELIGEYDERETEDETDSSTTLVGFGDRESSRDRHGTYLASCSVRNDDEL